MVRLGAVSGPVVNLIRPITQTEQYCSVEGSGTTVPEFREASDTNDDDAVDGNQDEVERAVTDYLIRAEEMQMDLLEMDKHMSDAMLKAIVLKGLPREYDNIVTLFNHGEEKEYQAVKLDLVNFANNRSGGGENSALMSGGGNKPKCSNCKRSGHTNADCRQAKKPSIKCYNCTKQGHMAKECRSTTQKPKCGHCNKMGHTDDKYWQKHGGGPSGGSTQRNFATSFNQDPFGFNFMAADNRDRDETMRDSGLKSRGNEQMRSYDMIVDSGCTGYMLKDCELFSVLDTTRGGVLGNANSSRSRIDGHGTAEF